MLAMRNFFVSSLPDWLRDKVDIVLGQARPN